MARPKNKKNARGRAKAPAQKASRKASATVAKPTKPAADVRARGPRPEVELAPCKFCEKMVDKSDMFCFGCKTVICDTCDVSMDEYGSGHSPEAHRREPDHVTW